MTGPVLHAHFVASSNTHSSASLRNIPPPVISTLYSVYPIIIATNRVLSFITWTSESSYRNFVLIALYELLVLHWNHYFTVLLPSLVVLLFCCSVWFIKQSFTNVLHSNTRSPTLEEILDSLDNLNLRFAFLMNLNPAPNTSHTPLYRNLLPNLVLLTPFYVFLMKRYISIDVWIAVVSLYIFTSYSTWSIAARILLWRWKPLRLVLEFLTSKKFPMVDKDLEITLLNLNVKDNVNDTTKILEFHVVENERRWLGVGWSKAMLLFESKAPYYSLESHRWIQKLDDFQFPRLSRYRNSAWKWIDPSWSIESDWTYYDSHWKSPCDKDSISRFTRSRRLKRRCIVVLKT